MDASFINSIAEPVKDAFNKADEKGRRQITDALRDIGYSIEPPEETMQRVMHQALTIAMVRLALDLKIFDILTANKEALSLPALVEQTGVDPLLLGSQLPRYLANIVKANKLIATVGRIMRYLSSMGMVKEPSKDSYTASNLTHNLSIPEIQAGMYFMHDVMGPVFQNIPESLKETSYQNPTDGANTTFQHAWKTGLTIFPWLHQRPAMTTHFNNFMRAQRMSTPKCFEFLNLRELCGNWPPDSPVFVDVGGGTGHQCIEVKQKFPDLPGKIVLQDLQAPVAEAELPDGIEKMAHDFFTPQPIKGAKFYYLRAILHDHSDAASLQILRQLYEAMAPESVLLLDEMVLPDQDVDWYATQTDINMMVTNASMERTQDMWQTLLGKAGMKIRKLTTYTYAFRLSVMEVVKKTDHED